MAENVFELEGIYNIDTDQVESAIGDVNDRIKEIIESMENLGEVQDEIFVSSGEQAEAFNDILEKTNNIGTDGVVSGLENMEESLEEAAIAAGTFEDIVDGAMREVESGADGAGDAFEGLANEAEASAEAAAGAIEEIPIAFEEIGPAAEAAGEEAADALDNLSESAGGVFDSISGGIAAIATAVLASSFIKGTEQQIAAELKLAEAIKRTDALTGSSVETFKEWASSVQLATGIGDELTLFLTGNLAPLADSEEGLQGITEATLDYAASLTKTGLIPTQRELIKAQEQVKAALDGQTSALEKQGIAFSELEQEVLKTGTESEKLAIVTAALNNQYGGLASSIFNASDELGRFNALGGFIGDFLEQLGQIILTTFDPVVKVLSDGVLALGGWLSNLQAMQGPLGIIITSIIGLGIVLVPTLLTTKLFSGSMQKLGFNSLFAKFGLDSFKISLSAATLGIAALVALVVVALFRSEQFTLLLDKLTAIFVKLAEKLLNAVIPIFDALMDILIPIIDLLVVLIDIALVPVIAILDLLFSVLAPLIDLFGVFLEIGLIPLIIVLKLVTPLLLLLTDVLIFLSNFVINDVVIPAFNQFLGIINKIVEGLNLLIKTANLIPGIDIALIENIPDIEPIVIIKPENIESEIGAADLEIVPTIDIAALTPEIDLAATIPTIEPAELMTVIEPEVELDLPGSLDMIDTLGALAEANIGAAAISAAAPIEKCECPPQTIDNSVNITNPNQLDTLETLEKVRTEQRINALFAFNN